MRTLLVAPRFVAQTGDYYEFPLGLCYVSACLKRAGFEVECLNLNHCEKDPEGAVAQAVRELEIDAVLSGGLSAHYHAVRQVFAAAKSARPEVLTVAGGGLISSEPELMLKALGLCAGVIGEGEISSVELMQALRQGAELADVPGLVYRDAKGIPRRSPERELLADLDAAPFPDYEAFGIERYLDQQRPSDNYYTYPLDKPRLLPVIASRSCPFHCTFCYHPLGKTYRRRSLDPFFAELKLYRERYGINMLAILDELFPTEPAWLEDFCQRISALDLRFIAQLRVSNMSAKTLRTMKEAGLFYVSYGIESASDTILRSMRKHTTVAQVDQTLSLTRLEGVGIQGNLLFGDPAETLDTARESLDWWERNSHYQLAMNFVVPYPGSAIYTQSFERGLIADKLAFIEQGCPPPNMTGLSEVEFESIGARIAQLKAGHRFFAEASAVPSGFDTGKGRQTHELTARCPWCETVNVYRYFVAGELEIFKLACRACNQRFDCSPLIFPHLAKRADPVIQALHKAKLDRRPLAGAPALFLPTFAEYLGLFGFGMDDFNWLFFLDERAKRIGLSYLPGVPVRAMSSHSLDKRPTDLAVFIPPFQGAHNIARRLVDDCGLDQAALIVASCADEDEQAPATSPN